MSKLADWLARSLVVVVAIAIAIQLSRSETDSNPDQIREPSVSNAMIYDR